MKLKTILFLGSVAFAASWFMDAQRQWRVQTDPQRGVGRKPWPRQSSDEDRLTAAIEDTFPASDPYQVGRTTSHAPDRPVHRRPAEIDPQSLERQAELLERKRAGG